MTAGELESSCLVASSGHTHTSLAALHAYYSASPSPRLPRSRHPLLCQASSSEPPSSRSRESSVLHPAAPRLGPQVQCSQPRHETFSRQGAMWQQRCAQEASCSSAAATGGPRVYQHRSLVQQAPHHQRQQHLGKGARALVAVRAVDRGFHHTGEHRVTRGPRSGWEGGRRRERGAAVGDKGGPPRAKSIRAIDRRGERGRGRWRSLPWCGAQQCRLPAGCPTARTAEPCFSPPPLRRSPDAASETLEAPRADGRAALHQPRRSSGPRSQRCRQHACAAI